MGPSYLHLGDPWVSVVVVEKAVLVALLFAFCKRQNVLRVLIFLLMMKFHVSRCQPGFSRLTRFC